MSSTTVSEMRRGRLVEILINGAAAEDVAQATANYIKQWPSLGYETCIGAPRPQSSGGFTAYGWRSATSD